MCLFRINEKREMYIHTKISRQFGQCACFICSFNKMYDQTKTCYLLSITFCHIAPYNVHSLLNVYLLDDSMLRSISTSSLFFFFLLFAIFSFYHRPHAHTHSLSVCSIVSVVVFVCLYINITTAYLYRCTRNDDHEGWQSDTNDNVCKFFFPSIFVLFLSRVFFFFLFGVLFFCFDALRMACNASGNVLYVTLSSAFV